MRSRRPSAFVRASARLASTPAMTGAGILALASGIALVLVARARSTERAEALEAATSA